jgi:hypothetical protein
LPSSETSCSTRPPPWWASAPLSSGRHRCDTAEAHDLPHGSDVSHVFTFQGAFLTLNSTPANMARNTGIFQVMVLGSGVVGNTVAYVLFKDVEDIDPSTRNMFVAILFSTSCAGTLMLVFTCPIPEVKKDVESPWKVMKMSFSLFGRTEMRLLSLFFMYMGMERTFGMGVYSVCLAFTKSFTASKVGVEIRNCEC